MADLTLYIGNRNYSSWSLRPWMLLRHLELPFREVQLLLGTADFHARLARIDAAGKVPVLVDGERVIWDSLAICEYVVEIAGLGLPEDPHARAVARCVSAEMHSGFTGLRETWPMNIRARGRRTPGHEQRARDLARIQQLWTDCRQRFGGSGEWLFGAYSMADAMFVPVATRLRTYGCELGGSAQAYAQTLLADPVFRAWEGAAEAEPWTVAHDEAGAPADDELRPPR